MITRNIERLYLNYVYQAMKRVPGSRLISWGSVRMGGLVDVTMEFANEFVESQFRGEYQRRLRAGVAS